MLDGTEVDGEVVGRGDPLTAGRSGLLMTDWSVRPQLIRGALSPAAVAAATAADPEAIPPAAVRPSLRGVASRGVAPGSAVEAATAATLCPRTLLLPVGVLGNASTAVGAVLPLRLEAAVALPALLATLVSRYDDALWGVAAPPEPASAAAALLAVAVVLSELGSLPGRHRPPRGVGGPPGGGLCGAGHPRRPVVPGIGLLAAAEVGASRWPAAGTHTATFALFGALPNDAPYSVAALRGTTVLQASTFLVIARAGCAPSLLVAVAAAVVAAYGAVVVPLSVWVVLGYGRGRAAAPTAAAAVVAVVVVAVTPNPYPNP